MSTATLHSEKKETLVPKLRFLSFEGNWELEKFGELVTNKSGKFNPVKEKSFTKCIELEHLATETGQLLGFIDGSNSRSIKNKFNEGDVLFGKLRPYLKKYLQASFDGVCSSEIWVLKGLKITNSFLYQIIQTNKFIDLANQSSGSKMPRADWNVVESGIFSFPTLPEQQKIASFLSAVDEKIQQLSRKAALLEQYKKGVMQQLFSGKLRFKDENGKDYPDWEEKKLGDVCEMTSSKRVYLNDYVNEGIPFYRGKEISELRLNQLPSDLLYISKKRYNDFKFKYGVPLKNDILITAVGTLGNVLRIRNDDPFYFKDGNLIWLRNISESSQFLEIILQWETKELIKTSIGSTQKALTMVELRKLTFNFPCIPEQQKIANFLSSIDIKIDGINQQLAQTQSFKKGLLQQMFV